LRKLVHYIIFNEPIFKKILLVQRPFILISKLNLLKNQANADSDGGCLHIRLLYLQKKA